MANSSLSLTSLDFDTLKNNLKTYMQSQSIFQDYNFEDSNLNVLLSILSYNSYLNSFYLNMVASEAFLYSAQLKDSVVSIAKELNYTPYSARSPKAIVDVTFQTNGIQNVFEIPKGTQFSGHNANGSFTYTTDVTHNITSGNNTFSITGLEIYEGTYINETYVVDNTIDRQRFILSNRNIDTDSLNVVVYENNNITNIDYKLTKTLYGLNSNSAVYFVQAYKDQFEIVFGDNVFGRKPQNNATVLATYRITKGTVGGGISAFVLDKNLGGYNNGTAVVSVTTVSPSDAGSNAEDIESIRFRAPKHFQTQERAITAEDYKTLILDQFPDIKTLNIYGGEVVSGINYGKIFISPVTHSGTVLSDSKKQDVKTFIQNKMTIGLTPILTNPDFLYIGSYISAIYNTTKTNLTPSDIKNGLFNIVTYFNSLYLQDFNITFRYIDFVEYLKSLNDAMVSVNANLYLEKIISPTLNTAQSFSVDFNNELVPTTLESTDFLLNDRNTYSIVDYNPNITVITRNISDHKTVITSSTNNLYLKQQSVSSVSYTPIGTIDYTNGKLNISEINIASYLNGKNGISIYANPVMNDISVMQNNLLEINLSEVEIKVDTL